MSGFRASGRVILALSIALWLAAAPAAATDLLDLYLQALELDPEFQTARLQVQIGEESIRESRSGLLPSFSASAQSVEVRQNVKDSQSILYTEGRTDYRNDNTAINLTQPLYRSDTYAAIKQARSGLKQAGFELAAEEQNLIYRVAETHFDYLAARDSLELSRAERIALERQRADAEGRQFAGVGTVTAVGEAAARATLARAAEIDAAASLEAARQAIGEITGRAPDDLKTLSETFPLDAPDPLDVEVWVDMARLQSPRGKALQAQAESLMYDMRRERNAARRPSLDLTGSITDSDSSGTEFGGGRQIVTNNVGLRLNVPIYDGGRSGAVLRARKLRYSQALQAIELERRAAEREARQAYDGLMNEIARADALRSAVDAQARVLREKQELLGAGLTTALEVLDATREVYAVRRDLAQSRYRYILNRLRLERAAGALAIDDLRWINAYLQ